MLFFGILSILLAVASANDCSEELKGVCRNINSVNKVDVMCNAKHGQIKHLEVDLQKYANLNLVSSYNYLLLSTYFGNFETQREGFKALYRKLSDKSWEDTINVLKYLGKRGVKANFGVAPSIDSQLGAKEVNYSEMESLSKALDIQKLLISEASHIHSVALQHVHPETPDAGTIHYMQEQFIEPQTERIRDLAGYITDMKDVVSEKENAIGVFLFDEYLKNSL